MDAPGPWWKIAGALGALGVALGAFGAHGLDDVVPGANLETWTTASRYHLIHAVALLGVAVHPGRPRVAGWLFTAGIALFSGSLYVLAVADAPFLGPVTPLGGLCLIAGWIALAVTPSRKIAP